MLLKAILNTVWYDIRGMFILWFAYSDSLIRQILFFSQNIKSAHLEVAFGSGSLYYLTSMLKKPKYICVVEPNEHRYLYYTLIKRIPFLKVDLFIKDYVENISRYSDKKFDSINIANAFHCFEKPESALNACYQCLNTNGTLFMNVISEERAGAVAKKINLWGKRKGILYKAYSQNELTHLISKTQFKITYIEMIKNSIFVKLSK